MAIPINDAIAISKQIRAGSSAATVHIGATSALSAHHPGDSVQVVWADPSSDRRFSTVTLAPGPPN